MGEVTLSAANFTATGAFGTAQDSLGNFADGGAALADTFYACDTRAGNYVRCDLGAPMLISEIRIMNVDNGAPGGWGPLYTNGRSLQYSYDDVNWVTSAILAGHTDGAYVKYYSSVTARYWRIFLAASNYVAVGEFRFYTSDDDLMGQDLN